ncbi:MAG: sigma-54-dependent Fis family transcriptional regulator [Deltaproteobacteria bacterium]|nr:sigma-54-dependent Fis family transcriptional regulator [Deltaproteobacteria bacterium]
MRPTQEKNKDSILVLDDEPHIRDLLRIRLESHGYDVVTASTGGEALEIARSTLLDLAVIDLKLEDGEDGLAVMEDLFLINPDLPVIILTAHGSISNAVEAMKRGAYCYLTKPYKSEELSLHVVKALERQHLTKEIANLKTILEERFQEQNIIGQSSSMKELFRQVQAIAPTDATVALHGESGTGKELIAKTIHLKSHRAKGPFVAVNCGALPENLLENELFGHMKGAYTDARESTPGLFAQADKGTVFLDEIGETSPALQVKLLRVLQEKEVRPLGGNESIKINVRVIVASNKNLKEAVMKGEFREDLFYRIYVVPLQLPSLRERRDDIPFLADHFLKEYILDADKQIQGITSKAMQKMMLYHWPGNIRELKNTIERAVILATHDLIDEPDLIFMVENVENDSGEERPAGALSYKDAKQEFEKHYLKQLLVQVKGNVSRAAKIAGQHRGDLYRLMKKHDLKADVFK